MHIITESWHTGGKHGLIIYREDGWAVGDAKVIHNHSTLEQAQRDAKCMAAAPDMLRTLIEVEQMMHAGELNQGTMDSVRICIEKATGGAA